MIPRLEAAEGDFREVDARAAGTSTETRVVDGLVIAPAALVGLMAVLALGAGCRRAGAVAPAAA